MGLPEDTPTIEDTPILANAPDVNGVEPPSNYPADIKVLRYPQDLSAEYLPHSLLFFVNVRQTDIGTAERATDRARAEVSVEQSNKNRPMSNTQDVIILKNAALPIIGSEVGGAVGKLVDTMGGGVGVVTAAGRIAGGVAGLIAGVSGFGDDFIKDRTTVLLKEVIALYTSGPQSVSYAASWAEEDLGLVAGGARALGETANAYREGGIKDSLSTLVKSLGGGAAAMALKAASKNNEVLGNIGSALKAGAAVTPNPFKAQLFNSMGFRKFSFAYTFLPRNKHEYDQCKKIIKTFKMYMHPEFSSDKFTVRYPAEWNIVHYYKGERNKELFRIANCALTNLKVTYGGGSDFVTFAKMPGAPTEMNVQVEFTELELLTKSRIESGDF